MGGLQSGTWAGTGDQPTTRNRKTSLREFKQTSNEKGYLDSQGMFLDGGKKYKLNLAKNPPVEKFVSIVVYGPQTRSQLQTGHPYPSKNNVRDKDTLIFNDDASFDLYFGPEPPEGEEANWIQTIPKKSWFCLLRLYSPTEAWFDKTWRPSEIELVK